MRLGNLRVRNLLISTIALSSVFVWGYMALAHFAALAL